LGGKTAEHGVRSSEATSKRDWKRCAKVRLHVYSSRQLCEGLSVFDKDFSCFRIPSVRQLYNVFSLPGNGVSRPTFDFLEEARFYGGFADAVSTSRFAAIRLPIARCVKRSGSVLGDARSPGTGDETEAGPIAQGGFVSNSEITIDEDARVPCPREAGEGFREFRLFV